jgi:malonate transporter
MQLRPLALAAVGTHNRAAQPTARPAMTALLEIILPVFGIVALGYAATFTRLFDEAAARGLSAFVFWFALPAMLFRGMAQAELPELDAPALFLAYYGSVVLVMALGALLAGGSWDRRALAGFGCGYSNTVLLGIPLALGAFGQAAAVPVYLVIAFHGPIVFTLVTATIELARGSRADLAGLPWRTLKGLLTNAILMAIVLGLIANQAGLGLPPALDRMVELLGRAALPGALFAMGAALRRYRLGGAMGGVVTIVAVKLVVHPLLVAALVLGPLALPPLWAKTAILLAALPTGINVYLFAARYGMAEAESAAAILLSTLLSIVSLTVLLHLLARLPA